MPEKQSTLGRFITGTFSTGLSETVTIILGFLCIMIYTRWMPKEDFGAFVLLQLIMSLVVTASGFGIDFSISKFIASSEDDEYKKRLINTAVYYRLVTLIMASVLVLFSKFVIESIWGASLLSHFLLYLPLLLVIETYASIYGAILAGNLRFTLAGLANIIYSIVSFILTIVFVIMLGQGVMGLIYARIISRGISLVYSYFASHPSHRLEFDWDILKKMLRFGFPLYINSFLNFGFTRADSLIIGGYLGTAEIAMYEVARKIPDSLEMLYNSFIHVYFPIVSKVHSAGDDQKVAKLLNYANRLLTLGGVIAAFLAFLFCQDIVLFLFSEQYLPSAPIFAVLVFGFVLIMLDANLGNTLVAIGESDKPAFINTARAILSLAGYILLIPAFGVIGAVISNMASTAIVNPINVFFLMRKKIRAWIPIYLKPIVLYFIFIQIVWLSGLDDFFWSISFILIFIFANFVLRVFTFDDINVIIKEIKSIVTRFISQPSLNT